MDKTPTWVWVLGALGIGALVAKFVLKPSPAPAVALGARQQQQRYNAAPPTPSTSSAQEGTLLGFLQAGLALLPAAVEEVRAVTTDYSVDNVTGE